MSTSDPSSTTNSTTPRQHIHFVTGRLAEHAVRAIVDQVAQSIGFDYTIDVLPITVAALMTPKWLLRHIQAPIQADRIVVPGYLENDVEELSKSLGRKLEAGPRDIRDLPEFFGKKRENRDALNDYKIEIIAEINHATRMKLERILEVALLLANDGADVIDLGCDPGHHWSQVGDAVKLLRDNGLRVSIDSFNNEEVATACNAGAELVLSVNSQNVRAAVDWGCEVVVIPDTPADEEIFSESIEFLSNHRVPMRLDPILEPIGCGFTTSLRRYINCRERYPDSRMMMGIGNITELTDADSAAINVVLLGICEELRIGSVLTTQVINWARSSVRECDLARRLVHFACRQQIPPKNIHSQLVLLRDSKLKEFPLTVFQELANSIRDANIRIFAQNGKIHVVSTGVNLSGKDPFELMDQLLASPIGPTINATHAFYLGFELSKAQTALTLGKQYEQDVALNWGFLTELEKHHRLKR
jgi:dihydropteroate synthase-like protein